MTAMEIAKRFNLMPNEVTAFIQANASFPFKRNFQTGEISIPDDIDIESFMQPLLREKEEIAQKIAEKKLLQQEEIRRQQLEAHRQQLEQRQAEYDRQEQTRQQQEELARKQKEAQYHLRIENLKAKNIDRYYEYKVIRLSDMARLFSTNSGRVDVASMTQILNELGIDGWHLVAAYSNEQGKNALTVGAGGVVLGLNSTVDDNILIFERFVKIP